jgi:hypothetical protein
LSRFGAISRSQQARNDLDCRQYPVLYFDPAKRA